MPLPLRMPYTYRRAHHTKPDAEARTLRGHALSNGPILTIAHVVAFQVPSTMMVRPAISSTSRHAFIREGTTRMKTQSPLSWRGSHPVFSWKIEAELASSWTSPVVRAIPSIIRTSRVSPSPTRTAGSRAMFRAVTLRCSVQKINSPESESQARLSGTRCGPRGPDVASHASPPDASFATESSLSVQSFAPPLARSLVWFACVGLGLVRTTSALTTLPQHANMTSA